METGGRLPVTLRKISWPVLDACDNEAAVD